MNNKLPSSGTLREQLSDRTVPLLLAALVILLAAGPFIPRWAMFLLNVSLSWGTVVLGMMLLMRTGLVSFGQGLYYCLGAYAAGALHHFYGVSDIALMLLASVLIAGAVAVVLGLLLAKYRDIFFAMLSLAFSMILFGLLVKTSALGSTDGFGLSVKTLAGVALSERWERYALFATTVVIAACAGLGMHKYLNSHLGRLAGAIRDNELRVEYMGASVRRVIHLNYVISAALAGIGGGLVGITIGHVDPEMAFWTTSGEFVFIAILSGTGNVLAPFLGATIFEGVRSFAYEYSPNTWQLVLGVTMLLVIMFLPGGLWSVFSRKKAA
ncbi:MAG TPA: branched-chain amino acid ABC transporter permease [Burkholderiales bacterium]|nr:branched-chain amino acid ABC transporter permease [Burkholderiales bacterium]